MTQHSPRLALLDLMLSEHDGVELMGDIWIQGYSSPLAIR